MGMTHENLLRISLSRSSTDRILCICSSNMDTTLKLSCNNRNNRPTLFSSFYFTCPATNHCGELYTYSATIFPHFDSNSMVVSIRIVQYIYGLEHGGWSASLIASRYGYHRDIENHPRPDSQGLPASRILASL